MEKPLGKEAGPARPRLVVHLDLDAFFAAVEVLENPELEGKPLVIGGRPEERGVVAAASYPARAFGIRSAMPMHRALALCPQAIVLPPRHRLYRDYSRQVMAILRAASPLLEQMSVDEACFELTDQVEQWEEGAEIARQIQARVRDEVGLSASLGVATNKLVAKVASDRDKPGGLTVVRPGEEAAFLAPLPVRVLWGVGPVTAHKLAELGVEEVGQLAQMAEVDLSNLFGKHGRAMARQANGLDRRPVVTEYTAKSTSQERTFARDIADLPALKRHLWKMCQRVAADLQRRGLAAGTVAVKLRYADFTTLGRQMALPVPISDEKAIYRAALTLLERAWQHGRPVRLLGVAGRQLTQPSGQLSLWE